MTTTIKLPGKASDFSGIVLKVAAKGDLAGVKQLIGHNPSWVHEVGPHGRTMLWEAAFKGRLEVVEYLLALGAPMDQPGCYYTPMLAEIDPVTAATVKPHTLVTKALVVHGARVDFHDACYIGLHTSVREHINDKPEVLELAKRNGQDSGAARPIYYAVAGSQPQILRMILEKDPSQANDGLLLRWAVWREHMDMIEQLLRCGADPASSGLTDWALDPNLKRLARHYGYEPHIDAPDWMGFPPLVDACRGNHNMPDDPARIIPLLNADADVNVRDAKNKTPLHRAAQAGFVAITKTLIAHGAELDAQDTDGQTPLHEAVHAGRSTSTRCLLLAGANPDMCDRKGRSPRDAAQRLRNKSRNNSDEIVQLFEHDQGR